MLNEQALADEYADVLGLNLPLLQQVDDFNRRTRGAPRVRYDVPHSHAEFVPGCFRCDLSRDEC